MVLSICACLISIHALREEGDLWSFLRCPLWLNFYPRPPRGGRPVDMRFLWSLWKFLSTPSARRATLDQFLDGIHISISIHALREEGDVMRSILVLAMHLFLSTPSARRATSCHSHRKGFQPISIHALREEGDLRFRAQGLDLSLKISIHALREEGDVRLVVRALASSIFLSTPSARRATTVSTDGAALGRFLSTPSARRATKDHGAEWVTKIFLSTPSARRATSMQLQSLCIW